MTDEREEGKFLEVGDNLGCLLAVMTIVTLLAAMEIVKIARGCHQKDCPHVEEAAIGDR